MNWVDNDIKIEMLKIKIKRLKENYNIKNNRLVDTWDSKVMNYINKKLSNEADNILREQISLISISFTNRKIYID